VQKSEKKNPRRKSSNRRALCAKIRKKKSQAEVEQPEGSLCKSDGTLSCGPQRFLGRVKSYDQGKCFGFVTSPSLAGKFGADIYIHHLEISRMENSHQLVPGQLLSFNVVKNRDNKPQVRGI
jgi:cold shock CspA family protein